MVWASALKLSAEPESRTWLGHPPLPQSSPMHAIARDQLNLKLALFRHCLLTEMVK
jgi:hypothetical protein